MSSKNWQTNKFIFPNFIYTLRILLVCGFKTKLLSPILEPQKRENIINEYNVRQNSKL